MRFLLAASVLLTLLVFPAYSATLTVNGSIWPLCSVAQTVTGPAIALSYDCSDFDPDSGVYGELRVDAFANDVYGEGSFRLRVDIPFSEEPIFVDSHLFLEARAGGFLSVAAASPAVDVTFSADCQGVAEFPPPCLLELNIDGREVQTVGSNLVFENIETNRPLPYTLRALTVSSVQCCDWESKDHAGSFSYDLRNPEIRDHETGELLRDAELRIVPEPAGGVLVGIGLIALGSLARRARRTSRCMASPTRSSSTSSRQASIASPE